jgi:Integrase core domain
VYSEVLDDEQAWTAAGFWCRASASYAALGINVERVISDNGSCYRSRVWRAALDATGITMKGTVPVDRRPTGRSSAST